MTGTNENVEPRESFTKFEREAEKNSEDSVGWGEWPEYDGGEYPSIVLQKQVIIELAEALQEESDCAGFKPVRVSIPPIETMVRGEENPELFIIEIPYSNKVIAASPWIGDYEQYVMQREE